MPTQIHNRPLRYEKRSRLFAQEARRAQTHFTSHAGDLFVSPDNREHVLKTHGFKVPTIFTTHRPTQGPQTGLANRPQTHEQRAQLLAHSDEVRHAASAAIKQKTVIDDDTRHALAIRSLLEFTKYAQPNPTRAVNALLLRQEPEAILALARHPILAPFHLASLKTLLTFGDLSLACEFLAQLWQKKKQGSLTSTTLTFELEKMNPQRVAEILSHLVINGQKELANCLIRAGLNLPNSHPEKCQGVLLDAYLTLQQQQPETYLPYQKITEQTSDFILSTLPQEIWWTLREMPELLGSALKYGRFVRELPPSLHEAFSSAARAVICDCLAKPFTDEERITWKRLKSNLTYLQQAGTAPVFFKDFLEQDMRTFGLQLVMPRHELFSIRAMNEPEQTELVMPATGVNAHKSDNQKITAFTRARGVAKTFKNPNDAWKAEILSLIEAGQDTLAAELAFFPLSELPKRWHVFSACLDPAITAKLLAALIQVDYVVQWLQALFSHVNNYDPDLETEIMQILAHLPIPEETLSDNQITLDDLLGALLKDPQQRSLGVTVLVDALFYGSEASNKRFMAAYERVSVGEDWYPLPYVIQTGKLSAEDSRQIIHAANEASYQAQAIKAIQTLNTNPADITAIKDTRKLLKNPSGPTQIKQMLEEALIKATPDKLKTIEKLKNKKDPYHYHLREMMAARDNNSLAAVMALMELKVNLFGEDLTIFPLADEPYRQKVLIYLKSLVEDSEDRATSFDDNEYFPNEAGPQLRQAEYADSFWMIAKLIFLLEKTQKINLAAHLLVLTVERKDPDIISYLGHADKWFGDIPKVEILVEVSSMKAANLIAGKMVLRCLEEHIDDIFTEASGLITEQFKTIATNIHEQRFLEHDRLSNADINILTGLADALEIKLYTRYYAILSPEEQILFLKDKFKRLKASGHNLHFAKSVLTNVWPIKSLFTLEQKADLTLDLLSHFEEMTTETKTEMLKLWAERDF